MLRTCCLAALLGTLPAVMHAAGTPDYDTLQQNDTRRISGRVTDDTGKPLMGVTVVEKGTTNGVSTTADGSYTLRLQNAENAVLEFSFIGYRNTELPAGTKTTLDVQLTESVTTMDNVVVIGYGTTTKKELTGSVSSLKSDDFKQGEHHQSAATAPGTGCRPEYRTRRRRRPQRRLRNPVAGHDHNGRRRFTAGRHRRRRGRRPVERQSRRHRLDRRAERRFGRCDLRHTRYERCDSGDDEKSPCGENRIEFSAYVAMQSVDKNPT